MIGSLMIWVSAVVLLVGMTAGIVMWIKEDFLLSPAHAHLNLVGGALLLLFGLYYRAVPAVGRCLLARIQHCLHIVGGLMFPIGIGITLLANHAYMAVPIIGSLIMLTAMALFVVIVLRTERAASVA